MSNSKNLAHSLGETENTIAPLVVWNVCKSIARTAAVLLFSRLPCLWLRWRLAVAGKPDGCS